MNKFNELCESLLNEGKTRKATFVGPQYDPSDMQVLFLKILADESNVFNYDDMRKYVSKTDMWKNWGVKFNTRYSGGYQQDSKWKGYLDVELDVEKYPDQSVITDIFNLMRSELKETMGR